MKKVLLSVCLISLAFFSASAQKADKDSIALIKFDKALADIEAKDFVIIVDSYAKEDGSFETNTDNSQFISYEKEFMFLQGPIIADNAHTNKLTVSDYSQETDKKGNVRICNAGDWLLYKGKSRDITEEEGRQLRRCYYNTY